MCNFVAVYIKYNGVFSDDKRKHCRAYNPNETRRTNIPVVILRAIRVSKSLG